MKEILKDLENIKGDILQNYKTIPIQYGIKKTKLLITILIGLTLIPVSFLISYHAVGQMEVYFSGSVITLFISIFMIWKARTKKHYVWLHNIVKVIIMLGVISIVLIDVDIVINRLF